MIVTKGRRGYVRPCAGNDVPHLARLNRAVWADSGSPPIPESYFAEILFHNPCYTPDLPSYVWVETDGSIAGFLGVMPRRMRWNGRPIQAAISHNFMVAPGTRATLAGVQLVKTFLAGAQDLSICEGNMASRRIWEGLGGTTALLYSLRWSRPLRPSRHLLSLLATRGLPGPIAGAASPVCGAVDAVVGRAFLPRRDGEALGEQLEAEAVLAGLPRFVKGRSLWPDYDLRSLRWLLDIVGRKRDRGTFRAVLVRDARNEPLGWYLYYARRGGASEVVQIAARDGSIDLVLEHLFHDAWRAGAVVVSGQMEPRFLQALSNKHCLFRDAGTRMLVHAREAELAHAIHRGNAFLSRLDGEWWINL